MVAIYKITSPNNKVYIGQTWNFKRRMNEYKGLNIKKQTYLYRSFTKYGVDNHKFDILYEFPNDVSQEIIHTYELLYWQQYKDCGFKLLNLTVPGIGPGRMSLETKEKIRKSSKYRKHTQESIEKMKLAQQNRAPISDETRKKMSDVAKGRKQSSETIEKRIAHRRGKPLDLDAKRSGAKITLEKVIEIKKLLKEFNSPLYVYNLLSKDPLITRDIVANISCNRTWSHIKI